jgi:hypothetical protein
MDDQVVTCSLYFEPKLWSHRYGEGIFTLNLVGYEIIDKTYCTYVLEIKWGQQIKTISKRYSEFYNLNYTLRKEKAIDAETCSSFPGKTWFSNLEEKFLKQRQVQLGKWLDDCLGKNKGSTNHEQVRTFLELPPI